MSCAAGLLLLQVQRFVKSGTLPLVLLVLAAPHVRVRHVAAAQPSHSPVRRLENGLVSGIDGIQTQVRCAHVFDLAQYVGLIGLPSARLRARNTIDVVLRVLVAHVDQLWHNACTMLVVHLEQRRVTLFSAAVQRSFLVSSQVSSRVLRVVAVILILDNMRIELVCQLLVTLLAVDLHASLRYFVLRVQLLKSVSVKVDLRMRGVLL